MPDEPRVIDLSVEVPGTPEQVWEAIATGPGISSWFVPHQVQEREGGRVLMDFGPGFGEEAAEVGAWEPPHRLELRTGGERALAFEWLIEARDGGTCVVRLVNSGFGPGEDWDAEYDGMSSGWPLFLENLRLHLTHFADRRARPVPVSRMVPTGLEAAFSRLCAVLGVAADLRAGDRFSTSGAGVPRLEGVVDSVGASARTRTYFLLLSEPAPGTGFLAAEAAGDVAAVSGYLYLYGESAGDLPDAWARFLQDRFPAPETADATS